MHQPFLIRLKAFFAHRWRFFYLFLFGLKTSIMYFIYTLGISIKKSIEYKVQNTKALIKLQLKKRLFPFMFVKLFSVAIPTQTPISILSISI